MSAGMAGIAGIAAVQARITELRTLVAPETVVATDAPTSTGASTSGVVAGGTSSASSFASALAAMGVDASSMASLSALTGTSSATSGSVVSATGTATGQGLVAAAEKYIGIPYVWGGETLSEGGLDCSGLVVRSMADIGVTGLPRVARDQMTIGTAVPSLAQALPGDLLVFQGGAHIAIYEGNGKMIDAPKPGKSVAIRDVYTEPTAIRRVLPQAATATSTASTELASALASATAQRTALDLMTQVAS
ncbi:MAG TPA: NlpC/P60 family protein [Cellulomonas sp.]|uniref:C40 family peptidase n=1 Tax=Cellulomonas sp. TaxID=40001 RepID=UPI002E2F64ED|nr:NlpC/P60 family protein [Cellulomonas sp.]HEX5332090.1 NlpC/P60 family protein [Cellulomonas sp.]